MTFNPNADVSNNRARRGGRTAAVAGGGVVGLGLIATIVINLLTGGNFDLTGLLGGTEQQPTSSSESSEVLNCDTGADANANDDCRLAAATLALDEYWAENLTGYRPPQPIIYDGQTSSACGTASNAVGPFYCPSDESVYIDPAFFALMRDQFGASAGNLAQLYILAHEYGHHVQYITGVMSDHPNNGTGPTSNGVRTELQADCYGGAWIGAMTEQEDEDGVPYLQAPTEQQLVDALNAAATVGDDNIQERSGSFVNPESFTHGSSDQREFWFATGYKNGVGSCDVFAVSDEQLLMP